MISDRKDVLLFTERLDKNEMKNVIESLELKDEILHLGQLGSTGVSMINQLIAKQLIISY